MATKRNPRAATTAATAPTGTGQPAPDGLAIPAELQDLLREDPALEARLLAAKARLLQRNWEKAISERRQEQELRMRAEAARETVAVIANKKLRGRHQLPPGRHEFIEECIAAGMKSWVKIYDAVKERNAEWVIKKRDRKTGNVTWIKVRSLKELHRQWKDRQKAPNQRANF